MIWRESFIYFETTGNTEVKEMSDHNYDSFDECEDCGLERRLYGGLCEECDNEKFNTFWTGDEEW